MPTGAPWDRLATDIMGPFPVTPRESFLAEKNRIEAHILKRHLALDKARFYCTLCMFRCNDRHLISFVPHLRQKETQISCNKYLGDLAYLKESPTPSIQNYSNGLCVLDTYSYSFASTIYVIIISNYYTNLSTTTIHHTISSNFSDVNNVFNNSFLYCPTLDQSLTIPSPSTNKTTTTTANLSSYLPIDVNDCHDYEVFSPEIGSPTRKVLGREVVAISKDEEEMECILPQLQGQDPPSTCGNLDARPAISNDTKKTD
ncbi:unnamed protein product [Mytilus coruscus]|uniref:Uncharacterized protein n=1 Tax=Mytilus coruscus TaxID=42192 RepID=A0A6J8C1V8_MYTCO|nr:unnamed protein product [Mytilus coruscus]